MKENKNLQPKRKNETEKSDYDDIDEWAEFRLNIIQTSHPKNKKSKLTAPL